MSGFSPEWLALREPADHRARDGHLMMKLADALQRQSAISVVDVGCGTGSNLRGTYAALGPEQNWTLVDYDARLLGAARAALTHWADTADADGERLILRKSGKILKVQFRQADLNTDLERALGDRPDLVTAAALFDLCSEPFIERFAAAVAKRRAVFFTTLTYNGVQRWTPRHASDAAMTAAFHAHQKTDKGFGISIGPDAPKSLLTAFESAAYAVQEGDSPWLLGPSDQVLIDALVPGYAQAVSETGLVGKDVIADWLAVSRRGSEVGHTDTLALPVR